MISFFKMQIAKFLLIGIVTVSVDFSLYSSFIFFSFPPPLAKACGFITGTVFAFFANQRFVFASKKSGWFLFVQFLLLYCISLAINIFLNQALLFYNYVLAFLLATATSASFNWLGMKFWIFSSKTSSYGPLGSYE